MADKKTFRPLVIVAACAVPILAMFLVPPIAQSTAYHAFADHRAMFGISNALNVISNLAFLAAGVYGLIGFRNRSSLSNAFAIGVVLTACGSAYYHYAPDTAALFWDRLPMTICFMSLSALVVGERIDGRIGRLLLLPLIIVGAATAVYWRMTETISAGDLRSYVLVQFLPLAVLPLVCALYPARTPDGGRLRLAFWWYVAAKVFEVLDARIFSLGGIVSGHTLKHLASGYACWWVLRLVREQRTE